MKSKIYKILMGTVTAMLMFLTFNVKVHAANCGVSISSASGDKDSTVTVNVSVKPDVAAAGQVGISFDTRYLEYLGSDSGDVSGGQGGTILIVSADISASGYSVPLRFKLKEVGSTTISVAQNTSIYPQIGTSDEPMKCSSSNGSIKINAPRTASSDSKLSSLSFQAVTSDGGSTNVAITPAFSPNETQYSAELAANVTRLVVSSSLSDGRARSSVSGTRIDPGDNTTTVTVTAEDGSVTKYVLYTKRAVEDTTEQDTSEKPSETTSTEEKTPKKIGDKFIIEDFTLVTIPEGFEESTITYNNEATKVLKGIAKPLIIICLADDEKGTNVKHYIYNQESGDVTPMVNISCVQKMYTVVPTPENFEVPKGYTETEIDMDGNKIKAWIKSENSDFCLIYAMNWNGDTSLYEYDKVEKTMQRFAEKDNTEEFVETPNSENDDENVVSKDEYDKMYDEYVSDHKKKNKQLMTLGLVMVALFIVFTIAIAVIYRKLSKKFASNDEIEFLDLDD